MANAEPSPPGTVARLVPMTMVSPVSGSWPMNVMKPGIWPSCPYSVSNLAMPRPYPEVGMAGSIAWMLSILVFCICASSSPPSTSAST